MTRELTLYDYVPVPYEKVKDALMRDAAGIFQRATTSAAARAGELVATLRVGVGVLEVGVDVKIDVRSVTETTSPLGERQTRIELAWTAARGAGLFPAMDATLSAYALSSNETQLDLQGRYRPPLGVVGDALDAALGQRVAQAAVLRFVEDVCARLRKELA
jgi:hypothetical protein